MNKMWKRFLAVSLCILLLLSAPMSVNIFAGFALTASAQSYSGTCGEKLTWTLDTDTGILAITGTGAMWDYDYSGTPWYSYSDSIRTVQIADSVTSVGYEAFSGCTSLTSVTIPDSVTSIGDLAFSGCTSLTSVTIPDSVTSIGAFAFSGCTSLTSVTIPDSVTSIGASVFYDTKIYKNASNWENDVLYIGNHLIKAKTSITGDYLVKSGTKTIANQAFYGCTSLTSVTIPDSVTSIGDDAFEGCTSLTSVTIPNSVKSIGWAAFRNCKSLTSVTIPDSVTSIGEYAFYNTEIYNNASNWENDVLYIGNHLIKAKTSITGDYLVKSGTKTIANQAFYDCTSLTSVTIPDSVTSIGDYAFCSCDSLTSITVKEGNPNYSSDEYGVLLNKDKTLLIQYPVGNTRTSYTIPDSVTSIGAGAFCDCTSLTSVTIGDSVTSIGFAAFFDCTSLTSVTIGDSVTSIGAGAFYECTSLTSVTIPDSVTSIGYDAFWFCTGLTSVTIGDSVTSIGNSAFRDCTSLTSVTIPNGVTSIRNYAFAECSSLNYVHIPESVTTIGSSILRDTPAYICSDTAESYAKKYAEANGIEFRVCEGHIPPHDHNYVSSVTAPTCTEQGYTTHTCTVCGDTYTDSVVDALGHSYKSVVTAPTCTEQGYTTHTCTVCGNSYRDSFVDPLPAIFIRNYKGETTVDYRTTITFAAEVHRPIDGAEIHWFVDGKDMGTGDTYTVKEAKKDINVQARYMEGKTVIAESEIETVKVKSGFFDKLKAFFRALFKKLPVLTQEYLGIERITTR